MRTAAIFKRFAAEGAIIGRLLAGYAELELGVLNCVQVVRDDLDTALKVMFRTRGETQRLRVADGFARQHYIALGLETEYRMAMSAVKYSLRVRNQFAHCVFHDDQSGKLAFVDLEELADVNAQVNDLLSLTMHYIDVPTLEALEAFFINTDAWVAWVNYEGRARAGKMKTNTLPKPKPMREPQLFLP